MRNIIFSSFGNDSLATIQWALEAGLKNIIVAYSDTKWTATSWNARIAKCKKYLDRNNVEFAVIDSEGFSNLVRRKMAFPANGMGFCSYELKIEPAMRWLDEVDPEREAVCYVGIMRIESERRKNWPEVLESSPNHGGRKLISPLATFSITERDALIKRAGFDVLPHRSWECSPCINATISDIQNIDEESLIKVVNLETEMGNGVRSGKPKYMFRPHRMGGAMGFEQVKEWADQGGGHYSPDQEDLFGCDSGYCG